jgi:hypothetical protein
MKLHLDALMKVQENPELQQTDLGMQQGEASGVPPATRGTAVEEQPMSPSQEAGLSI